MRDELWKKLIQRPPLGYVIQLWSSRAPRGFDYRQYGESKRMLDDFEGLALVVLRGKNRKTQLVERRNKKRRTVGGPVEPGSTSAVPATAAPDPSPEVHF